jgi:putative methionine-R-sulfoxide reductase with GAF domain
MCGAFPADACVFTPYVGLARTIYIRCTYSVFGRKITRYTVKYGVCIYVYTVLANPNHMYT